MMHGPSPAVPQTPSGNGDQILYVNWDTPPSPGGLSIGVRWLSPPLKPHTRRFYSDDVAWRFSPWKACILELGLSEPPKHAADWNLAIVPHAARLQYGRNKECSVPPSTHCPQRWHQLTRTFWSWNSTILTPGILRLRQYGSCRPRLNACRATWSPTY